MTFLSICHTKHFNRLLNSRYDIPLYCHTEILNPYDICIHCHTDIFIFSDTHTVTYTRTFSFVFQVFSSKTCWLLDFKHYLLAGYVVFQVLSRIAAGFLSFWNPLRPIHWVRPSCPFLTEFNRVCADSVTLWPCTISIDRFILDWIRLSLKP